MYAEEPAAIGLLEPAEMLVAVVPTRKGRRIGEHRVDALAHRGPEPLLAPVVDRVLEPRPVTVGAVAVIALHADDCLGDVREMFPFDPAQLGGQPGIGVFFTGMAHAHPAPHEHDEAGCAVELVGDQPDILGVDVDAVVAGPRQADLELAG